MHLTIRDAFGQTHADICVHGAGGPADRASVERAIRRANSGRTLGIYESEPGHARVYATNARADHDERVINLRGARVL